MLVKIKRDNLLPHLRLLREGERLSCQCETAASRAWASGSIGSSPRSSAKPPAPRRGLCVGLANNLARSSTPHARPLSPHSFKPTVKMNLIHLAFAVLSLLAVRAFAQSTYCSAGQSVGCIPPLSEHTPPDRPLSAILQGHVILQLSICQRA